MPTGAYPAEQYILTQILCQSMQPACTGCCCLIERARQLQRSSSTTDAIWARSRLFNESEAHTLRYEHITRQAQSEGFSTPSPAAPASITTNRFVLRNGTVCHHRESGNSPRGWTSRQAVVAVPSTHNCQRNQSDAPSPNAICNMAADDARAAGVVTREQDARQQSLVRFTIGGVTHSARIFGSTIRLARHRQ